MKFLISCIGRGSDHVLDDLDLRMFLWGMRQVRIIILEALTFLLEVLQDLKIIKD